MPGPRKSRPTDSSDSSSRSAAFGLNSTPLTRLHPAVADKDDAIDRVALAKQNVVLFIDGETCRVVELFEQIRRAGRRS